MFDAAGPFHLRYLPSLLPWLLRFALACTPRRFERAVSALRPLGFESWRMHLDYLRQGIDTGLDHQGALLTGRRVRA